MSLLESLIYGFISGATEFLPVSSRAHQALLRYMFGMNTRNSLQELLVHMGLLFAVFISCREVLLRLRREQNTSAMRRYKGKRAIDSQSYYDLRLIKTAVAPLIIGLFLTILTAKLESNLLAVMVFLGVNAFVLLLAEHTRHGNRDSRTMSGLDGVMMGLLGALSAFPGISRTGMIASYGTMRAVDSDHACNWAFLLGIPAILFAVCYDILGIIIAGIGGISFVVFLGFVLSGLMAFCGGYLGISLLRVILKHSGFSRFAYYSIGAAIFSFILYLIT